MIFDLTAYSKGDPIAAVYRQMVKQRQQVQPITPMGVNRQTIKKDSEDMAIYGRVDIDTTSNKFVNAVIEQSKSKPKGPYEYGALVRLRTAAFSHELFVVINSTPTYVQVQELGGSRTFMYPNDYVTRARQPVLRADPTIQPVTRPLAVQNTPGKEIVAKNIAKQAISDNTTTLFDLSHNKTVEDL